MPTKTATRRGVIHLGLDVSKNTISVGILRPDERVPDTEKIAHDEESIRRLVDRLGRPSGLWACYEAGPTGYELHRLLASLGVRCDVIAPSLIPVAPGDKVKTDKRDCKRLARLHRAGELSTIRVPTREEQGLRELCRARRAAVKDLRRARQRVSSFLLLHSHIWRAGSEWTIKHHEWLGTQVFDDQGSQIAYAFYRGELSNAEANLEGIEFELLQSVDHPRYADAVQRLAAYRGIDLIGALTLATEICDWRRFSTAGSFMGFCGLIPREYSSGQSTWRGKITGAGNVSVRTQLIESAWAYRHPPCVSVGLKRRHEGVDADTIARSWKAQVRLSGRFRRLSTRKGASGTVAAAIARELAGFVWAEMTA